MLIGLLAAAPLATAAEHAAMRGGHDHAAMVAAAKPVAWTGYPLLTIRQGGANREPIPIAPQNIVTEGIDAYSNDLGDVNGYRQLTLGVGGAKLDKPAAGGFHWLSAREERADKVLVASAVYYYGERGARNPTAMFMQPKQELEIVPQPFPREHARYRAGETWKFLVRFHGNPLPGQKVVMETQNGTRSEWVSDAQGVVSVQVPDDFKTEAAQEAAGRHAHGAPGAEFVLATEYVAGGQTFLTGFNSSYGRNAFDQRSLALGAGFTLLGMIGALPLLRQRRTVRKSGEAANA